MVELYLLRYGEEPYQIVTKEHWVSAERLAGFVNRVGPQSEPGTGGFSTTKIRNGASISGVIVNLDHFRPDWYDWNPELRDLVVKHIASLRNKGE